MNGKPIPRNKNGLIERACLDCGKMRYSKHGWPRDRCTSCSKKHRFKSQPAVGLKTIDNMDKVIDNGITLCDKCHHKTIGHEDEYINYFISLLKGDLCGKRQ